jgi:hypothetical protein
MVLTFNGKPFKASDFEKAMMKQMTEQVAEKVRERIGSIRHPETGEFPVVSVRGNSLHDMRLHIEASNELIAIIRSKLSDEELAELGIQFDDEADAPRIFLSYASEDRDLARVIAERLNEEGIETWWAEWEIGAGDSIVEKVNDGLAGCTHFIVLLTETSIEKPWVKSEIDAGFIRRLSGSAKFIPLRNNFPASKLPPLLAALHAPEVAPDQEDGLKQLINDIRGVSRKPSVGQPPVREPEPASVSSGYSAAAMAIAEYYCRNTKSAIWYDPQVEPEDLAEATGLTFDDVEDALYELRDFFRDDPHHLMPQNGLWTEFDKYFFPDRDPAKDALQIAVDMMNDDEFPEELSKIAERYGWDERRLNPAVTYLIDRNLVEDVNFLGNGNWVTAQIEKTAATRRFVKSRASG